MADVRREKKLGDMDFHQSPAAQDRLKILYPVVNEEETPLPRTWSPKDKYNYIGLSQNNLRVHYKGRPSDTAVVYLKKCSNPIFLNIG